MTNNSTKLKLHTLLLFACLLPVHALADNTYTVTVDFDKKTIYVDSLSLPKSFKAEGILKILPELLQRPGDMLASNYDIQIDGMSTADASDVALSQINLDAIEKIEVSESPVSTYLHCGQGGSINIVLRKTPPKPNSNGWGSASVEIGYETDIAPFAQVNYKDDKLFITGLLMGEYYNASESTQTKDAETVILSSKQREDFRDNFSRIYAEYRPTEKDQFSFNVSETMSRTKYGIDYSALLGDYTSIQHEDANDNLSIFHAAGQYKRTVGPRSAFVAEVHYIYEPGNKNGVYTEDGDVTRDKDVAYHTNSLSDRLDYSTSLLPKSNPNSINLNFGVSNTCMWKHSDYSVATTESQHSYIDLERTYHIMPYANLEMKFGKLRFKAVGEYQFFRSVITLNNRRLEPKTSTKDRSDITGKVMFCWQFDSNKHLRLCLSRNIMRPSLMQTYPYTYYDLDQNAYTNGNIDLKPVVSREVTLDYITNFDWSGHKLTLNAGVGYNYICDIFYPEVTLENDNISYYFVNNGNDHIGSSTLMALYSYKWFSCSLTGNIFENDIQYPMQDNHIIYYNVALLSSVHTKNGWMASLNLTYYSKYKTDYYNVDPSLVAQINVGKDFGSWNVHLTGTASLTGKAATHTDYYLTLASLIHDCIGAGVTYHF